MKNKIAGELRRRIMEMTKLMSDKILDKFLDDIVLVLNDLADIGAMEHILGKMEKAVREK